MALEPIGSWYPVSYRTPRALKDAPPPRNLYEKGFWPETFFGAKINLCKIWGNFRKCTKFGRMLGAFFTDGNEETKVWWGGVPPLQLWSQGLRSQTSTSG